MIHIENRPPQLDSCSPVLQQLRQLLKQSGYHTAGIAPNFECVNPDPEGVPTGSPLHPLLRLFYSQEPVDPAALRVPLQPLTLEQVLETGFCRIDGESVRSNVFLQPYNDLLFAIGALSLEPRPEDSLMGISLSSLELAHLMAPRPSRNALDLGTGCGFLAALLSQNSERVYAVDLSATAVHFAEFNARWNGFTNITCLQGNIFESVRHLRFNLIVSNPPFFICPVPSSAANQMLFKHSGIEGDSFCIQLARDVSTFLEEDGFFHMMFSWLEFRGQDWQDKLAAAFSGLGCDVGVLRTHEESAEDYVSAWCNLLDQNEQAEVESLYHQGLDYFEQKNASSVGTGLLSFRRCSNRPNLLWFDDAPDDRSQPYDSSVASVFDIRARFDPATDDALLQQKFTAAPDLVTIQKASLQNSEWQTTDSELNRESGLRYSFNSVDPFLSHVVSCLDGRSSLQQVLEQLSREEHLPLADVSSKHLPSLRELLRFGFILPASAPPVLSP